MAAKDKGVFKRPQKVLKWKFAWVDPDSFSDVITTSMWTRNTIRFSEGFTYCLVASDVHDTSIFSFAKHVIVATGKVYLPRLINVHPYHFSSLRSPIFWLMMKSLIVLFFSLLPLVLNHLLSLFSTFCYLGFN